MCLFVCARAHFVGRTCMSGSGLLCNGRATLDCTANVAARPQIDDRPIAASLWRLVEAVPHLTAYMQELTCTTNMFCGGLYGLDAARLDVLPKHRVQRPTAV